MADGHPYTGVRGFHSNIDRDFNDLEGYEGVHNTLGLVEKRSRNAAVGLGVDRYSNLQRQLAIENFGRLSYL